MAEPPTTTSSTPFSLNTAETTLASFRCLNVGSCSLVMSARARRMLSGSMGKSAAYFDALGMVLKRCRASLFQTGVSFFLTARTRRRPQRARAGVLARG